VFPFEEHFFDSSTLNPLGLYVNLVGHFVAYSQPFNLDSCSFLGTLVYLYTYRVPQNSRNNSMGQSQFMLENNEKMKKCSSKSAALISFILSTKKDLFYLGIISESL
jgi:hypothetical protein